MNSVDLTKDKKILATGDDFGFVKVFEFPVKVNVPQGMAIFETEKFLNVSCTA